MITTYGASPRSSRIRGEVAARIHLGRDCSVIISVEPPDALHMSLATPGGTAHLLRLSMVAALDLERALGAAVGELARLCAVGANDAKTARGSGSV